MVWSSLLKDKTVMGRVEWSSSWRDTVRKAEKGDTTAEGKGKDIVTRQGVYGSAREV